VSLEKFFLKLSQETPGALAKLKAGKDFGMRQGKKTLDSVMGSPRAATAGALGGAGGLAAYLHESAEGEEPELSDEELLQMLVRQG
jgi:hypothetical protein